METQTEQVTLRLEVIAAEEMRGRWAGRIDPAEYDASHYRAILGYQGRSSAFRFSTGSGWGRPPVAREVLETVLSDAVSVVGADDERSAAEIVAGDFGIEDEAEARRMAAACMATLAKVRRLLGSDARVALDDPERFAWSVTDDPPTTIEAPSRVRASGTRRHSSRVGKMADGMPVNVEIGLRDKDGFVELSVCSSTPHGGGQDRESVAGVVDFAPGWDVERVARLLEVWERWHLNGMNAACEHQRADGWTEKASEEITLYYWRTTQETRRAIREAEKAAAEALRSGQTVALAPETLALVALPSEVTTASAEPPAGPYMANGPQYEGDQFNRASEVKTRGWVRPEEHPAGLLAAPCPTCGYRYGSAWLREELPADILEWLAQFSGLEGVSV